MVELFGVDNDKYPQVAYFRSVNAHISSDKARNSHCPKLWWLVQRPQFKIVMEKLIQFDQFLVKNGDFEISKRSESVPEANPGQP